MRRTLFNVQFLRLIAASSILFTHAAGLVFPDSAMVANVPWVAGVDVFFVISGFIMTWMTDGQFGSRAASKNFLMRRVIRIAPPYWFFTLLTAAAVIVAGGRIKNVTADPLQILTSLTFVPWPRIDGELLPIVPQGWTLNYEAFFYLAFALCMCFRRGLALLVVLFTILALSSPLIPGRWFVFRFFADPIILEFVAGIALARLYMSGIRLRPVFSLVMLAVALAYFLGMPAFHGAYYRPLQYGIPATLLAAAFILGPEPERIGRLGRAVVAGGDSSYTLYLSHKLTVAVALLACAYAGLTSKAFMLGLAISASLAFAFCFYRYLEAPTVAALGNRFRLRGTAVAAAVAP